MAIGVVGLAHADAYTSFVGVVDVGVDVPYVAFIASPDIDPAVAVDVAAIDVVDVDVVVVAVDDVDPLGVAANANIVAAAVAATSAFVVVDDDDVVGDVVSAADVGVMLLPL